MRLSWSLFLLGLLGQSAIANPVPMYEESIQRPDQDPFKSYTSSRAKHQGRAKQEEVRRRGNEGMAARAGAPYLSQDMMVRRDGWSGEDDVLEGYERHLRPELDFGKVSTVPTEMRELAEKLTRGRSLGDKYEEQLAPCSGASRRPLGIPAEEEESTDLTSPSCPSSLLYRPSPSQTPPPWKSASTTGTSAHHSAPVAHGEVLFSSHSPGWEV